jgi:nucleoside-diphosphate-sugar epimerase
MRYFVTGATGFIGGSLARQLVEGGHQVIALARDASKTTELRRLGVVVCEGDITDKESMREGMRGADGVFHLAAWYRIGARDKKAAEEINIRGTRNVLELMRELSIPKGIYTSTLAVFSDTGGKLPDETYRHNGPWLSEYDRTKWMAHYEVAEPMMKDGLPLVIVQPGLVYGPGDTSSLRTALIDYLRGRLPVTPDKTAFCWAHVDDTARGHLLAMERGKAGETYVIAGPVHTFREAFEIAENITGIKAPRLHPGSGLMKAMSKLMGVVGAIIPLPESYTAEGLRVVAGVTYIASNEKARRELGLNPRPLEEGLRETLFHEMSLLGMATAQVQT